jgi:hypothetical protein
MKKLALLILLAFSSVSLQAKEPDLTEAQVKEIAALIMTKIYKSKDFTVDKITYDAASGNWQFFEAWGIGGFLACDIRDLDGHYRVMTAAGNRRDEEFRMHTSLRRRIEKIIGKKPNKP